MAKTIGQLTQATTIAGGDEFVIEQSGLTKKVAASVVRGGLVNADIDAAAAIAFSKLAALDSANILVGNGSNVATKVAVTGDVTISNSGVTAIGNAKVLPAMLSQPYTLATAQSSTSGTSIDFTGIPSWAKRITVMLNSVSTNGTSIVQVQIGSSSFTTSSYSSHSCAIDGSTAGAASASSGFIIDSGGSAAFSRTGLVEIRLVGSNTWVSTHALGVSGSANARGHFGGGAAPALAGALDRVRITTVNGTDTFDAGTINIAYEG